MIDLGYEVLIGDCFNTLDQIEDESIDTCVTSPPYWSLRDYGEKGQIGLEDTPEEYVENLVKIFRKVRQKMKSEGTLWLNLGDTFAQEAHGVLKPKDLIGIPWRVAFALQADGWWLRQDIVWAKPNPMPEPVKDRCTRSHEFVFLLSKSKKYYYDHEAILEPIGESMKSRLKAGVQDTNGREYQHDEKSRMGKKSANHMFRSEDSIERGYKGRNKRDVWFISAKPYRGAHFAVYPPELVEPCILAGCPPGGLVLDPFGGSGTTAAVAIKNRRNAILCELSEDYVSLIDDRIASIAGGFRQGQKTLGDF